MNKTFTATLLREEKESAWTYLIWPESATFFETRKPVKVKGTIDGHEFQATFLPMGDGTHMLPVKKATFALLKKQPGDSVEVCLTERL